MEAVYIAPDIECAGCAESIQKALGRQSGVQRVEVAVPTKTVTVQFDAGQTSREAIAETLTDVGFPPSAE